MHLSLIVFSPIKTKRILTAVDYLFFLQTWALSLAREFLQKVGFKGVGRPSVDLR